jgi:hypothetical protein
MLRVLRRDAQTLSSCREEFERSADWLTRRACLAEASERGEVARTRKRADVAQLAEHVLGKDEVTGSIPVIGSSLRSLTRVSARASQLLVSLKPEGLKRAAWASQAKDILLQRRRRRGGPDS